MTMLTTNFSLHEMIKSETASRRDMDNTPHNDDVVQNLTTLCEQVLQPLRDVYGVGIKVNSGYRSPDVNAAVGGSRTSDHCKGQAADIEIPGVANRDLALYIRDNFEFTQLILEGYIEGIPDSGWVHVSYDVNNLKQQVLTAVFVKGRAIYSNGIA